MTIEKMIKQLEDISRLMESDIFHLDEDDTMLQYDYDGNDKMLEGINQAIGIFKLRVLLNKEVK